LEIQVKGIDMIVAGMKVRIHLHMALSLKQKRSEVKRILARIKARFPVSYAEVGALDKWQVAELGFSCVSNDPAVCDRMLDSVIDEIESKADAEIMDNWRDEVRM